MTKNEALAQPDAFEQGRQEGIKQERALWELSRRGQEIEADPPKIGCVQHDCDECKARLAQPVQEPVFCEYCCGNDDADFGLPTDHCTDCPRPTQRPWVGLMRGVRVEGDTVVISVKGGNDAARELCGALLEEKNK